MMKVKREEKKSKTKRENNKNKTRIKANSTWYLQQHKNLSLST